MTNQLDSSSPAKPQKAHKPGSRMAIWIVILSLIGIAVGAATRHLVLGIAVGVGAGVLIGAALDRMRRSRPEKRQSSWTRPL